MVPLFDLEREGLASAASRRMWYVFRDHRHYGPFTSEEIKEWISKGYLLKSHHLWRPGYANWDLIDHFDLFRSYYRATPDTGVSDFEFAHIAFQSSPFADLEFSVEPSSELPKSQSPSERWRSLQLKWRYFLAATFLLMALASVATLLKSDAPSFMDRLSSSQKHRLVEATKTPYRSRYAVVEVVVIQNDGQISLVGGTNLSEEHILQIHLEGDPETLLGRHRAQIQIPYKTKEKLFYIPSLGFSTGESPPPGEYNLSITCSSCPGSDRILFSDHIQVGDTRSQKYQQELSQYHIQVARRARAELSELEEILATLDLQVSQTLKRYEEIQKLPSSQRTSQWTNFSSSWKSFMRDIQAMFNPMDDEGFQSELFYDELYKDLRSASLALSEIHSLQGTLITEKQTDVYSLSVVLLEKTTILQKQIDSVRARRNLMESQLGNGTQMPSRAGMSAVQRG